MTTEDIDADELFADALKIADRREALCRGMKPCPACGTMQVQLVDHIAVPAKWKCRQCGHRFEHEAAQ